MLDGSQGLFLELVNDIIYVVRLEKKGVPSTARVEYINRKVKDITGYEPEDFIKNPSLWISIVHPDDRKKILKKALDILNRKRGGIREYRVRTSAGRYVWVEDRIIPVLEKGKVAGFIGVARDITKRKVLTDLSFLALGGNLRELLEKATLWTADALSADVVVIYEVPEGSKEGILRAGFGIEKKVINRYRLPLKEGTEFHYTYTSKKPVIVRDVEKEKRFSLGPDTFLLGLKSGVCIPIRGRNKPYGTLCIYTKKKRDFGGDDVEFGESVAGILGLAIERARFEEGVLEAERRLKKANRLYRTLSVIGEIILREKNRNELLKKVCNATLLYGGFKGVWIGLFEDSKLKIVSTCGEIEDFIREVEKPVLDRLKEGVGPCGRAFTTGEVVINNDTERFIEPEFLRNEMLKRGFLSSASVPLKLGDKVVGLMVLYASERDFFDEETESLVKEIADELNFALDFLEKEEKLRRFSLAVEQTSDWVLITDENGVVQYANRAVEEITGYSLEELIGRKPSLFKSGKHSERFYRSLWNTILSGTTFRSVFVNRKKSGELFYLDQTITPLKDREGRIIGFVSTGKDITQEKALRERLEYVTLYDPVTELPNRANFIDRLSFYISRAKATGRLIAVCFLDIDRFKYINDTYGYQTGDAVLKEIARRLKGSLRPGDTVARLGSDEFGLIMTDVDRKEAIPRVLSRVVKAFERPIRVNGNEIKLNVSMGVSVFPDDGDDPEGLLRKAEMALSHAKESFSNTYQFYREEMNARIAEFMLMEKHLSKALEKGEYVLHFQPCYSLRDGSLHAFEALLRWNSEDLGLVPPSRFVPILEETGLIVSVGEWAVREVCRKIKLWKEPISVNVSAVQFRREDFPEMVRRILEEEDVNGGFLILEITESVIMENIDLTKRSLEELKELGVKIAIDDFGTGYSSLAYLKLLPVDALKIDVSFVRDIDRDPNDRAIVNAIVQLAKNLGLMVTAEGIENEQQLNILKKMGCDFGQGYYLSKPLPESEVSRMLSLS